MEKKTILRLGAIMGLIIILIALGSCVPAEESEEGGLGSISMIIFVVLFLAILYFVMIRPQRKRLKEHRDLGAQLKSGDRVVTGAGIYGEIESVSDESVVLKVESGATIRVTKDSIAARRQK